MTTLYYVHDPMCSWCWAFRPTWERLRAGLAPDIEVRRVLGGLAPDSAEPMPAPMRAYLQQTWQRIQQVVPGTEFNFDFWRVCEPRRSTYPACRAVIAAAAQDPGQEEPMIRAIQEAYYLNARNPSDNRTLVELARDLGLDGERFAAELDAPATRAALAEDMRLAGRLGVEGFPSLVVERDGRLQRLPCDYHDPAPTLAALAA